MGLRARSGRRPTRYVGKVLFVKAGESLSLQFHRVKDESWLVQSGRARLELGSAGDAMLKRRGDRPGASFHFRPGHGASRHRDRGHDHPRGLDAAPRRPSSGLERPLRPRRARARPSCLGTARINVRDLRAGCRSRDGGRDASSSRADAARALTRQRGSTGPRPTTASRLRDRPRLRRRSAAETTIGIRIPTGPEDLMVLSRMPAGIGLTLDREASS